MFGSIDPSNIIAFLIAMVIGVTLHEMMHAVTANYLGDPTGKYQGRITLNPMAHFDALGAILLFIMAIYGFGFTYGKPVPVNPRNLRPDPQKGMAIVAAAGPLTNLVIAIVVGFVLRGLNTIPLDFLTLAQAQLLYHILNVIVFVNLLLFLFNLIPIPPLDGYKIIQLFFSPRMYYEMSRFEQYGPMLLLLVLFLPGGANLLFGVINPPMEKLYSLIVGV